MCQNGVLCSALLKWSRTSWGPAGTNSVCVPCLLFVGNTLHSASLNFPDFHRADSKVAYQGREREYKKTKESSQEQ